MTFRKFTNLAIICFMLLGVTYAFGNKAVDSKTKAKARYFYLKGSVSSANENYDQAYEYFKRAFELDPGYVEAGFDYGVHRLVLDDDTFSSKSEINRSLSFMRGMIDSYPRDIVAGESYAYYAMEADTLEEALRVYNLLVKEHPGLSRLYYPQSVIYMQLGQVDSAVNAMRQFERLEGASSETLVRKISYLLSKNDTVSSMNEVRDYILTNPGNPRVILDASMIYAAMEHPDTAMMILENALDEFPGNGDIQFDLGLLYLDKGDTTKFHKLMGEALTSDYFQYEDKMDGLKMYLSKLPTQGGDFKESDRLLRELNSQYPNDVVLLNLTADYNYAKGDKKGAFELIKKAYSLDSEDPYLLGRLLTYALIADKPAEGMKVYEAYPNENDKYMFSLGLSYMAAAEAVKEYDKALETADKMLKNEVPGLSIYSVSEEITPDSLAENYLPNDLLVVSAIYEVAGDLYGRMNKPTDAVRNYENSLSIPVDNPSVMNNYAYYIIETLKAKPGSKEFERAKKMSYESIQQTQESPQGNYYDTYGWILFKEQNYKDAKEYIEVALELEGDNPPAEIVSHYGDILFMSGDPDEALRQWKRALEIDPSNQTLKKKVDHKTFFYE